MAEELKLDSPNALRDWLKDKPIAWSQIIAIRIALRMLPMIGRAMKLEKKPRGNDYRAILVTSVFRACCMSWTAHKFLSRDISVVGGVGTYAAYYDAAYDARDADADAAYYAAAYAVRAAYVARAADAAAYAARAAASASAYDANNILMHVARDAAWLDAQGKADNSSHAARLAKQPLWHESAPQSLQADWLTFKTSSFAADTRYQPWIRWYEAVAPFDPQTPPRDLFSDNLTIRIATQPDEWWRRPALVINTNIARWLAEEETSSEPPTEDLPTQLAEALDQLPGQQPAPYQFDWRDGRMEVLPPEALPEDGGIAQDYLDETREKANSLFDHLARSNVDPDIARKVGKLREALTERAADLRPAVVDSRTITVERLLKRLDNPQDAAELSSRILSDLDDLAETARRLCQCLPELWLRDVELLARGLTGDSAAALLTNLNALRDGIKDAEIIGPDVQAAFDTLSEESAEPADEALKKRRTAMFAVTVRNFLNALLRVAKGSSPVVAGELLRFAKDVGKELRPELVKATAKIVLSGVSITAIAGLFVSLSIPIDGIWRLIPGAETVGRIVEYLKAGSSEAPPLEPSVPPPPTPPRTARPTSEKGPTRPA
jgi:hypothetical protein